jgi:hypothetical protein
MQTSIIVTNKWNQTIKQIKQIVINVTCCTFAQKKIQHQQQPNNEPPRKKSDRLVNRQPRAHTNKASSP